MFPDFSPNCLRTSLRLFFPPGYNLRAPAFLQLPHRLFATAGFAYIGAMVCSIEALKYVNFPTKELGKSCKVKCRGGEGMGGCRRKGGMGGGGGGTGGRTHFFIAVVI